MLIKHVLSHFTKFVKTRFMAKKSGSQLRCRAMLKMLWNIQKTPPKHVKRLLNFFFLNTVLGLRTIRKHQLNMFWGFLRIFWKSGSRLKNPVLGSDVEQCEKIPWNTQKTCFEAFWEFLENPVLGSKIRFSAQMSNNAKNTLKHSENAN